MSEIKKIKLKDLPANVRTLLKHLKSGNFMFSAIGHYPVTRKSHDSRMEAMEYLNDLNYSNNLNVSLYFMTEYENLLDYGVYVHITPDREGIYEDIPTNVIINKFFE